MQYVTIEKQTVEGGSMAIFRMNKPPANALDIEFIDEFYSKFLDIDASVVILTGTGKFFIAGRILAKWSSCLPLKLSNFPLRATNL